MHCVQMDLRPQCLHGTYAGDNIFCGAANCPSPGACCLPNLTCQQLAPADCTAANGVYNGNITFAFDDNSIQNVQVLLVLSSGAVARPAAPGVRPAACAASSCPACS